MPFQLGIMTDEVSQRIEDAIRVAKDFGLTTLELRSVDGLQLHQLERQRIEQIGGQIHEAGLTVCALSTPVFKCHLDDPEEIANSKEILIKDLQIARMLGAGIIRGFSFWAQEGTTFEQAFPGIVKELQSIVPHLEEARIVYALEFDPAVYASNGAKVARLAEAVGSPYIRALYDPGNDLWDPDGEVPFPDGYRLLLPYICHIHLKDAVRRGSEVEAVAIGTGEVDYKGLFAKLAEDCYDGYCIVETHYRLKSKLTEEQLKRPSGHLFSEGGEEASRQCLESLFRLLEELPSVTNMSKGRRTRMTNVEPQRRFKADRLTVQVYSNRRDLGTAAGSEAATAIRVKLQRQDKVRIVFAAAPSQNEFLEQLRKEEGIDWSRVTAFHMDEYIGLPKDAPQRFSRFLKERFFEAVPLGAVHYIDGTEGAEAECRRYAELIQEAPVDIVCLGIGENGHIAFNDPPVADFADPETVKCVELDEACRQQQVNDGCFPDLASVPTHALTLTIPALLAGSQLFCMVPGPTKRAAVHRTLNGPVSTECPASILREHPDCVLYVDTESYGG